jgi:exopolysaccharide/PEP-CTERM locus tyrosine autokinase
LGKFSDALEKYTRQQKNGSDVRLTAIESLSDGEPDAPRAVKRETVVPIKPKSKKKLAPSLVAVSQPHSYEAEQFRTLKTNLLFSGDRGIPRTIMVTSAVPDEGKSFVAANLAVTFAQSLDEHVLLMDCDLRLPTVHRVFGINDTDPGLSDVLAGRIETPAALHKTGVEKLTVLPGGTIPPNPTELLSSRRMKNLLMEVEARYNDRYVIIDSPPPLLTAETMAIARQVDGILIVIKHESTSRKDVKEMVELLDRDKIIGVIVNRYDVRLAKYYGYGKYQSYYGKK